MRRRVIAALVFAVPSSFAFADDEGAYLLTMPFEYGDHVMSDRCRRAAEIGGAACDLVPLGTGGGALTVINAIGTRNTLIDRWQSEISIPDMAPEGGPDTVPSIDVVVNPCWRMDCGPDAACRWDSSKPWLAAQCIRISDDVVIGPKPIWPSVPAGRLVPLLSVNPEEISTAETEGTNDKNEQPAAQMNIPDCGVELLPGKICMGKYILDENRKRWMIP